MPLKLSHCIPTVSSAEKECIYVLGVLRTSGYQNTKEMQSIIPEV